MNQVNEKMTKKEILSAYADVKDALKKSQAKKKKETPSRHLQVIKNEESVEAADSMDFQVILANVKSKYDEFSFEFIEAFEEYLKLKRAIQAKQDDLITVHDIEAEADTLAKILSVQAEVRDQANEATLSQKKEWDERADSLAKCHNKIKYDLMAEHKNLKDKLEFEHKQLRQLNSLEAQRIEEENRAMSEVLEKSKEGLEELGLRLDEKENDLKKREAAYKGKADGRAQSKFNQELALEKAKMEAEISVAATTCGALRSDNEKQTATISSLEGQLKESYARIESITKAAMESAASHKVIVNSSKD